MQTLVEIIGDLPIYQIIIAAILIITTIIQLYYWLSYARISAFRLSHHIKLLEKAKSSTTENPCDTNDKSQGISVVMVMNEFYQFDSEVLSKILNQDYPEFELVIVNDCAGSDLDIELSQFALSNPRLVFTTLKKDDYFKHSKKVALLIGIKAAKHERLIFTAPEFEPSSDKWLSQMARGFEAGDLVIGYSASEPLKNSFISRWEQSANLQRSIRYIAAAIADHPYRGSHANIGYTKQLFYSNRGYSHLNMHIGEDDLFVQKVSQKTNTGVVIGPSCKTICRPTSINRHKLMEQYRVRLFAHKLYPLKVRFNIGLELTSRFLLLSSAIVLMVLAITSLVGYMAIMLFLMRELIVFRVISKTRSRLDDKDSRLFHLLVYDTLEPISGIGLRVINKFSKKLSGIYVERIKQ